MRKNFLAIYALVGALVASPVFTSCVDNEESASVTQLRGAKAEQLKAAAALAQAQAAAEAVEAEALAAYQKAQAAYYQAQADQKNQQIEQAAQEFAATIETIKAQAALNLLNIQKEVENVKNELTDAEYDRFNELYNQYQNELSKLTNLKNSLLSQKADLALLEANVISADAWNKANTISAQNEIANYKAQLAVYQENKDLDNATLQAKAEAARIEAELAQKNFNAGEEPAKLVAANKLVQEKNEAMDEIRNTINNINNNYYIVEYDWGYMSVRIHGNNGYNYSSYTNGYNYFENIRINENNKLNATRYYSANVEYWATELGTTEDTKDKNTAYGRLAAANADMTVAKALPETTDEEKEAKKQAIANAETAIAQATDNLAYYQKNYDDAVERQAEFTELLATLDVEAANKLAEEMIAANEANEKAWEAWEEAYEGINEKWEEYNALQNLAWNAGTDINQIVANLEAEIAQREADLVSYQRNNAEETLAMAKESIAQLEAKIEIQEKVVAERKAALDALLTEETPAE